MKKTLPKAFTDLRLFSNRNVLIIIFLLQSGFVFSGVRDTTNQTIIKIHNIEGLTGNIEEQEKIIYDAVELLNEAINSQVFQNYMLDYDFGQVFDYIPSPAEKFDNQKILNLLLEAHEPDHHLNKLERNDRVIDISLKFISSSEKPESMKEHYLAAAFAYSGKSEISVIREFFINGSAEEFANTLIHEYMHVLGFSHRDDISRDVDVAFGYGNGFMAYMKWRKSHILERIKIQSENVELLDKRELIEGNKRYYKNGVLQFEIRQSSEENYTMLRYDTCGFLLTESDYAKSIRSSGDFSLTEKRAYDMGKRVIWVETRDPVSSLVKEKVHYYKYGGVWIRKLYDRTDSKDTKITVTSYFENGDKQIECTMLKDGNAYYTKEFLDGPLRIYNKGSDLLYELNYSKGYLSDTLDFSSNGQLIEIPFRNGSVNGVVKFKADGKNYQLLVKDNFRDGKVYEISKKGSLKEVSGSEFMIINFGYRIHSAVKEPYITLDKVIRELVSLLEPIDAMIKSD